MDIAVAHALLSRSHNYFRRLGVGTEYEQKVEVLSPLLDNFSAADDSLSLPESPLANLFLY